MKACIAKRTKRYDFPDKKVVDNSWSHDLSKLLRPAELEKNLTQKGEKDKDFEKYWNAVQAWNVDFRYDPDIFKKQATDMYQAVVNRKSEVLRWIKEHW